MEWNAETLQFLSQCFLNTLSPNPGPRRAAEASLAEASEKLNYGLAVLRLLMESSVDEQIRQSAAVNFKNHLKARWNPSSRSDRNLPTANPIPDPEKEQIKSLIVSLMLSSTARIQSQLCEALVVIGKHDFPKSWPSLLPELIAMLQNAVKVGDFSSINGILGTVNSLCKKFRYEYGNTDLRIDLKYCLDNFAAPLLEVFTRTSVMVDSAVGSNRPAGELKPLFECLRLCCRVSYSFNFQELPEFFEDHMEEWMVLFRKYLITTYPTLEQGGVRGAGDELGVVDSLRAAICDILSLYMDRNEEPFEKYVDAFGRDVRDLLVSASANAGREQLAITAMKFLTTLSMRSPQNSLFSDDASLGQICSGIVVPNVMIREEEEELFDMNYVEFIRRDMEGSDLDTRRRIACELLKAIAANYGERVRQLSLSLINGMLESSDWKCKDCAIYLVLSLATNRAGGASVPTGFIEVGDFFTNVIVPELRSQDVNGSPFLKAGALKFFTVFRSLLPKQNALALIPDVVRFLGSESNVVHSYSAICIEKLLLVKDGGVARYQANDVAPFFPVLMTNLFNALKFPESEENQYIMKCIMRVLGVADISREVAGTCITGLTSLLNEVCKNPKSPTFNHYLFEAVAVLIKRSCMNSPDLVSAFEGSLLPCLQNILVNNVIEFFPYAFQLLAQLVELNRPPLPTHYAHFFDILLTPDLWKKSSDVPALVRLLQAFLRMSSSELNRNEKLNKVLGIFNQLISSPSTEEQGFFVLNTIIENLEYAVIGEYMGHIWISLFQRLQNKKTPKFVRCLVILMSLILVKHGWKNLVDSMNSVQPNVFMTILDQFWIPNLRQITGALEVKLTAVASTKLICECPALLEPGAARCWGKMLDSIVTLLSRPEQERVDDETEVPDFVEASGYTATFVRLYNAGKKDEDPLKDIKDPKIFLISSLSSLPGFSSGVYQNVITENLEPANQAVLLQGFSG